MSSSYHIPMPRSFLAVNTPVNKSASSDATAPALDSHHFDHGFLSNRPATRHASVSSTVSNVSEHASASPPSSPPTVAATGPVLATKNLTPLALNAKKHASVPMPSIADMTPVARSAFLSNRGAGF
ncbi:hypothetical protein ACEQ8H_008252 [Pleosporales sp. CAS-2024a]